MGEQQKAYLRYKQYQQKHQISLDLVKDPKDIQSLTYLQLVKHCSIVSKIYNLRLRFRNKYFNPDQWDSNHEKYFVYLLGVLNTYENLIDKKLLEVKAEVKPIELNVCERQWELEEEEVEVEVDTCQEEPTSTPNKTTKILSKIRQNKLERAEFERTWNCQVKQLKQASDNECDYICLTFYLIYCHLETINPEITVVEVVDVVHYFIECICIIHQAGWEGWKTSNVVVTFESFEYSRDPREFCYYHKGIKETFVDIYRYICSYDKDPMNKLIQTISEVTSKTLRYTMHYLDMKPVGVNGGSVCMGLFPAVKNRSRDFSKMDVKGKACLIVYEAGYNKGDDNKFIIHEFKDNSLKNVIIKNVRQKAREYSERRTELKREWCGW